MFNTKIKQQGNELYLIIFLKKMEHLENKHLGDAAESLCLWDWREEEVDGKEPVAELDHGTGSRPPLPFSGLAVQCKTWRTLTTRSTSSQGAFVDK